MDPTNSLMSDGTPAAAGGTTGQAVAGGLGIGGGIPPQLQTRPLPSASGNPTTTPPGPGLAGAAHEGDPTGVASALRGDFAVLGGGAHGGLAATGAAGGGGGSTAGGGIGGPGGDAQAPRSHGAGGATGGEAGGAAPPIDARWAPYAAFKGITHPVCNRAVSIDTLRQEVGAQGLLLSTRGLSHDAYDDFQAAVAWARSTAGVTSADLAALPPGLLKRLREMLSVHANSPDIVLLTLLGHAGGSLPGPAGGQGRGPGGQPPPPPPPLPPSFANLCRERGIAVDASPEAGAALVAKWGAAAAPTSAEALSEAVATLAFLQSAALQDIEFLSPVMLAQAAALVRCRHVDPGSLHGFV